MGGYLEKREDDDLESVVDHKGKVDVGEDDICIW